MTWLMIDSAGLFRGILQLICLLLLCAKKHELRGVKTNRIRKGPRSCCTESFASFEQSCALLQIRET